jgi:hypothetical protein
MSNPKDTEESQRLTRTVVAEIPGREVRRVALASTSLKVFAVTIVHPHWHTQAMTLGTQLHTAL